MWMIGVIALLIFILIAATYNTHVVEGIDKNAADMLFGNKFLEAFHIIGNTETIIILSLIAALILYLVKKKWQAPLFIIVAVALGYGLNQLLKAIFERPRPDVVDQLTSFSFPSGHAMATTICLLTITFVLHQQFHSDRFYYVYTLAFITAVLVALSRVAGARHFFSDVAAGVSLGVAFVIAIGYLYKKYIR